MDIESFSNNFYYPKNSGGHNEIYNRENGIEQSRYSQNVLIIGCGGIGSWVAKLVGSIYEVKNIFIFDGDVISESNLNRTPFTFSSIGAYKVEFIAKLINDTDPNKNIYPIPCAFNKGNFEELFKYIETSNAHIFENIMGGHTIVFDCRDDYYGDYDILAGKFYKTKLIRAAYNGTSMTLDLKPMDKKVWGQAGYTVVPSKIMPTFMIAALAVEAGYNYNSLLENKKFSDNMCAMTLDIDDIIPSLIEIHCNKKEN